jgi:hypothetical protein
MTYHKIAHQQLSCRVFGQRKPVWHLRTVGLLAQMAVSHSWEADWVWAGGIDETFEFFDEVNGGYVDRRANTGSSERAQSEEGSNCASLGEHYGGLWIPIRSEKKR